MRDESEWQGCAGVVGSSPTQPQPAETLAKQNAAILRAQENCNYFHAPGIICMKCGWYRAPEVSPPTQPPESAAPAGKDDPCRALLWRIVKSHAAVFGSYTTREAGQLAGRRWERLLDEIADLAEKALDESGPLVPVPERAELQQRRDMP